jgi:hypothetical protein
MTSESAAMELVIFLLLFVASVTVGLAGARAFFYVIFRLMTRGTGQLAVSHALPPNPAP